MGQSIKALQMLKLIWKFYIPLLVFFLGIVTFYSDPNERILKSIPIVPGEHRTIISLGLILIGIVLGAIVYAQEKTPKK